MKYKKKMKYERKPLLVLNNFQPLNPQFLIRSIILVI